ncbi:isoprenoid synthase domain-containing protein [Amanita rubescens]|nr:isoprenoid synthase domain-containing protein [Amanita rubescens]
MSTTMDPPSYFFLPDLASYCTYPLRINPNGEEQGRASQEWLIEGGDLTPKKKRVIMQLKGGDLTAACFPDADPFHLRACCDYINYLFNLDDWLEELDVQGNNSVENCCIAAMRDPVNFQTDKKAGLLMKSFFSRFSQTAGRVCQERFIRNKQHFFAAVARQVEAKMQGYVPDLESYVEMRRDTGCCKPCFQLIEYVGGLTLPDEVTEDPIIQSLEEAANDFITWSNDLYSYNVEQARNDTHNMVAVVMQDNSLTLQEAVNIVGDMCKASFDRFEHDRQHVSSWGDEIDHDVIKYIDGLQNWMAGNIHWSFSSERYFGKLGPEIKSSLKVELLPKKTDQAVE